MIERQKQIKSICDTFLNAKKIAITTHIKPDGDAIGSEIGLGIFLKSLGIEVRIINDNPATENYNFLLKSFETEVYNKTSHSNFLQSCDAIAVLDANRLERFPSLIDDIKKSNAKIICIDHHTEPEMFYSISLIDEMSASTGELIFEIVSEIDKTKITKEIATALYTAIMTDTGSFRFGSTSDKTHKITSELISIGAVPNEIYQNIYEQESIEKMQLISRALSSIEIAHEGKLSTMELLKKDFSETKTNEQDVENIINFGLTLKKVILTILFTELDGRIKIGFRSKGSMPVNLFAKEFGGGGHLNAASATVLNGKIDEVKQTVLERVSFYLNNIN